MKKIHILQKVIGFIIIAVSSFLALGFIINISEAGEVKSDDIAALIILVVLPIIGSVWMIRNVNRKSSNALYNQKEREVLTIAKAKNGKLTASELAMNSNMSLKEAEATLNEFHRNGYALIGNADNGAVVYDFHELLSAEAKNNSQNLYGS